jgi:hypothetical protein
MEIFEGRDALIEMADACRNIEGGTVSPGGASAILGVSRQMIHKLVEKGELRCWAIREMPYWTVALIEMDFSKRIVYMSISVHDVVRYGIRVGRLQKKSDMRLGINMSDEEFENLREEVDSVNRTAVK